MSAPPDPLVPVRYRVEATQVELPGTTTLVLAPLDEAIARPSPGQFTMLWAFGVGEVPISLSGVEGERLVQTIRDVGAVTHALCAARPGEVIGVRGPYGTAWDLDGTAGNDVVVLAGGLGLAPLRPAVRHLVAGRTGGGRVHVLVGARSPRELLYVDELAIWDQVPGVDVHVTVDRATPGWIGDVGVVTTLVARLGLDPDRTRALVCGPEVMMRFGALALTDAGLPPDAIQVSLERTMHCGAGLCGHCQLGPLLLCRDGAVVPWSAVDGLLRVRGL